MKKICSQCQTEMIDNCDVLVQGGAYGIKIRKKWKGLFNSVSATPRASVCPNCGYVAFYIDEYK